MADYVTVKMHDKATFQAAVAALPKSNVLSRLISVDKVYLKDLGLRNLNNPALLAGQALYMEHWDGLSPPVDIRDLLLGDKSAFSSNKGRIKFLHSDEVQQSIQVGLIKKYIDAGLFEVESYETDLPVDKLFLAMSEPTGFPNRDDSNIIFDPSNRRFTITPTFDSYKYYRGGIEVEVFSDHSVIIDDVSGTHFIYFDRNTGILTSTPTFDISLIRSHAYVAFVHWNEPDQNAVLIGDERHGITMDGATHEYLHFVNGAVYIFGLLPTVNVDASGDLDSSAYVDVGNGQIRDEDIVHDIKNASPQIISPIAEIPVLYRIGSDEWYISSVDQFPLLYNGKDGWIGTLPAWNEFVGGSWKLTEVSNNNFFFMHLVATNDIRYPLVMLMGTNQYVSIGQARNDSEVEFLTLNNMPFQEMTPIATFIYQASTSYLNTPKARLRSTDTNEDFVDWRIIFRFIPR